MFDKTGKVRNLAIVKFNIEIGKILIIIISVFFNQIQHCLNLIMAQSSDDFYLNLVCSIWNFFCISMELLVNFFPQSI